MKRTSPDIIQQPFIVDVEQFDNNFLEFNFTNFLEHFLSNSAFCKRFYTVYNLYTFYYTGRGGIGLTTSLFNYEVEELRYCCYYSNIPMDIIGVIQTAFFWLASKFTTRRKLGDLIIWDGIKYYGRDIITKMFDEKDGFSYHSHFSALDEINASILSHYVVFHCGNNLSQLQITEPTNKYDHLCTLLAQIITSFRISEITYELWVPGTHCVEFFQIGLIIQMLKNDACSKYTGGRYNAKFLFHVAFRIEQRIQEMLEYLEKRSPQMAVNSDVEDWIKVIQALLIYSNIDVIPIASKANPINKSPEFYHPTDSCCANFRLPFGALHFWECILISCFYPCHLSYNSVKVYIPPITSDDDLQFSIKVAPPQWNDFPKVLLDESSKRIEHVLQGIVQIDEEALLIANKDVVNKF